MTFAFVTLVLAQGLHVSVLDVSKPDAIYEDVSRGLAEQVATELTRAGCIAVRIDETELPKGCKLGPCLGEMAARRQVDIVVTLDAQEQGEADAKVMLTSLRGTNGQFLGGAKYVTTPSKNQVPKALLTFAQTTLTSLTAEAPKVATEPKPKKPRVKKKK